VLEELIISIHTVDHVRLHLTLFLYDIIAGIDLHYPRSLLTDNFEHLYTIRWLS
jgi:hypothetical protein